MPLSEGVIEIPVESAHSENSERHPATASRSGPGIAHLAAWVLVVAFVGLVLSVAVPAITGGSNADLAAALLFMVGLTASLLGTGLTFVASIARVRTALGAVLVLAGLVLLYGLVPSLAALGVVLLGVAVEVGSLPGD